MFSFFNAGWFKNNKYLCIRMKWYFFFFGGVLNFGKYLCENKVVKKWNKFEKNGVVFILLF